MSELIQVPAMVVNMNPKADRSWKLVFETRELSGSEVKILADNFQGEGYLLFKPNEDIIPAEIPQEQAESGTKSQSQRLRDVLYLVWKSRGSKGSFNSFYDVQYEKLIESYKEKILSD